MITDKLLLIDFMNITTRSATGVISAVKRHQSALYNQMEKPIKLSSLRMTEGAFVSAVLDEIFQCLISHSDGHIPVICQESRPTWRKKVFPEYKDGRVKTSELDWKDFYELHEKLYNRLSSCNLFIPMKVGLCEGDDIIGVLSLDALSNDNIILSNDGDFLQLSHKANIISRNAPNGSYWGVQTESFAKTKLIRKLFTGDSGDNIKPVVPRITGPVTTEKMITEGVDPVLSVNSWLDQLDAKYPELSVKKRYKRNQILIDLSMINHILKDRITKEYMVKRQGFKPDFYELGKIVMEYGLSELQKSIDFASRKLKYKVGIL